MTRYQSWGRLPKAAHEVVRMNWRDMALPDTSGKCLLPFGNGHSYGDSCLNDQGILVDARGLDRLIVFDAVAGTLRCEAGALLSEILALGVPRGWFLPVTSGTQFVTIAGPIANDVHGKNHHRAGTFGQHVRRLELQRSDGSRLKCAPTENSEWFRVTVGGLARKFLLVTILLRPRRICHLRRPVRAVRCSELLGSNDLLETNDSIASAAIIPTTGIMGSRYRNIT